MARKWGVAALVVGNIALTSRFDAWPDRYQMDASDVHKSIGIVVSVLR